MFTLPSLVRPFFRDYKANTKAPKVAFVSKTTDRLERAIKWRLA